MSALADKVMELEARLEKLEAYCDYLERAQDAIYEAQSYHVGNLSCPCPSEIDECLHEAEQARDTIAEVLGGVRDL
tara:strand:+ start:2712 stop:2939 length:228 start_codon:yes stop_codon:yes gene_type:complete